MSRRKLCRLWPPLRMDVIACVELALLIVGAAGCAFLFNFWVIKTHRLGGLAAGGVQSIN